MPTKEKYEMTPCEFYIDEITNMKDGNRLYRLSPIKLQRICPCCGGTGTIHGSANERKVRDLSSDDSLVGLIIQTNRYKCKNCGHTWVDSFESIDTSAKITNRMKEYIQNKSLGTPFKVLADDLGLSDTTIKRIFDEYIQTLEANRVIYAPTVLGIDENHLMNRFRAVFVDVEKRKLIEIKESRAKEVVKDYIQSLPDYNNQIKVVTMDMWKPYREAVKETIPNAVIVVDKFHVIKEVNKALEIKRKSIQNSLSKEDRKYLKNSRYLLLSAQENLDIAKEQKLEDMLKRFPSLELPYRIKELFREFYKQDSRDEAERWYNNIKSVIDDYDELSDFKKVLKTIDNWHDEIFNYFDYSYTNAITENINRAINEIGMAGKGYSFSTLRAKALYQKEAKKKAKFEFPPHK